MACLLYLEAKPQTRESDDQRGGISVRWDSLEPPTTDALVVAIIGTQPSEFDEFLLAHGLGVSFNGHVPKVG